MDGGVESGFKHVPIEKYRPRLLHVRGRKNFRVTEVPLHGNSLCCNDMFILDAGLVIYNWIGSKCNPFEKFKASSVCNSIKEERKSVPKVVPIEQGKESDEFWKLLGGKVEVSYRKEGEEEKFEKVLYKLSDSSGNLEMTLISKGKDITRDMLKPDDVFIFDIGYEIYAWVGSGASNDEKKYSLQRAQLYMIQNKRPLTLPICSLKEGRETEAFENAFKI